MRVNIFDLFVVYFITHYQHLYISTLKHDGYSQHKTSNVFPKNILANNFRHPMFNATFNSIWVILWLHVSYGRWIYNYLCKQFLWLILSLNLETTLCDNVWQWLEAYRWFSPGSSVSSTNKNEHHNITQIDHLPYDTCTTTTPHFVMRNNWQL
jgi:hypothetical protein